LRPPDSWQLIHLAAVLSISIGLLNLFRSGCSMAATFCSMSSKASAAVPLSERAQEYGFRVGLAIVLC